MKLKFPDAYRESLAALGLEFVETLLAAIVWVAMQLGKLTVWLDSWTRPRDQPPNHYLWTVRENLYHVNETLKLWEKRGPSCR